MEGNKYSKALFQYGFLTLLYLLNEYEQEENYTECSLIVDTLTTFNSKYNLNLPTTPGVEAVRYFKSEISKMGYTGIVAMNNIKHYADCVKTMA